MFAVSEEAVEGSDVTAEVRLMRHIILNAVLDAIYGSCLTYENSAQIKTEAWNWFAHAGADFRAICDSAGFNPDTVKRDALLYIARERANVSTKTRRPSLHVQRTSQRRAA